MPPRTYLFTSESVSMGHPDKMADQISDAILDAMLAQDPRSRVACETLVTTGLALIAGEVTCDGYVDIASVVRQTVKGIGYDDGDKGFDYNSCSVLVSLDQQSPDINQGVDRVGGEQGAGDQGLMFGFACRETESLMPLPIDLSHRLVFQQAKARESGEIPHLRPDAKSQVTVEYIDDQPARVHTVVLSTQHGPEWNKTQDELAKQVIKHIIRPVLGEWWNDDIKVHINPTGKFELGGPHGDCGLTGRKIIVDTYGGRGRHGGGAFSGKDPSKVDRSAAYMARYIAKNIVAADLADECEVQLSYAIGVAAPTSVNVNCNGTARIDEVKIAELIRDHFELTPAGIIRSLKLLNPIYSTTAAHGHFGRTPGAVEVEVMENGRPVTKTFETFTWEKTDKAAALKAAAGSLATATA